MTPDKFLTDLAALTGCDSVHIEWRGYWHDPAKRFEITLGKLNNTNPCDWSLFYGTGPTVEDAMQDARAKLAAHYAGEPA